MEKLLKPSIQNSLVCVTLQSVSKSQPCDVIKIKDNPSLFAGFLSHFSSHLPPFYDVTWLIFETLWKVT